MEPPNRFNLIQSIYGEADAAAIEQQLSALVDRAREQIRPATGIPLSHQDSILITYGDMVQDEGEPPLQTLHRFLSETVGGTLSSVHILPFYPYSSDDGFSVIDYNQVDPALGSWADVGRLSGSFELMFDAVINHISVQSDWFQKFLAGEPPYTDYFVTVDPAVDLSSVFRPRALPLLTPFETDRGVQHVWTTFSADQVDLNYGNPAVLLDVIDLLLDYVIKGARLIRLDAIGFMWKEIGTTSIHLPQTHAAIQLMREVLNEVAPDVLLVTETNVPHKDNISYFGDGTNEAQMVYNFSLPPLTLHAFHSGDATILTRWASILELPSDQVTFFNFLASHDGVGLTPARGYLDEATIQKMATRVEALGGQVSYKTNSDGSQSPYELNINYLNALGDPDQEESDALKAKRFLATQAIMLSMRGVPGIYFHSLFGSENWLDGVAQTGRNRTINREKLAYGQISAELADDQSLRAAVFRPYLNLLNKRREEPAFDPYGAQKVCELHPSVFSVLRGEGDQQILCLINVSAQSLTLKIPASVWGEAHPALTDLISGEGHDPQAMDLPGYGVVWLKG